MVTPHGPETDIYQATGCIDGALLRCFVLFLCCFMLFYAIS